jgi:hypothetical protein
MTTRIGQQRTGQPRQESLVRTVTTEQQGQEARKGSRDTIKWGNIDRLLTHGSFKNSFRQLSTIFLHKKSLNLFSNVRGRSQPWKV